MAQGRHEADSKTLGKVGEMAESLESEYGFWRLVTGLRLSPNEVDTWDLEDIDKANAVMTMNEDYKSAYHEMMDHQMRQRQEKQ